MITIPEALKAVEEAFRYCGRGLTQMPAKIYLHLDKYEGDFRAMPAYIAGMEACGIKWVNVYPRNRRFNLPAVMALVILSDPKTGFPLCIMDATLLTNLRTGAAGGVAAKYLARKDSSVVAMVGCGAQARTQLASLKEFFKIRSVLVWGHKMQYAQTFIEDMHYLKLDMHPVDTVRACVKDADIVVTATPVRRPIVRSAWIRPGTHINAIGADAKGKEELQLQLVKRAKVIVDDKKQALHSGEINVPFSKGLFLEKNIYATLGDIVAGKKKGRTNKNEVTIFDSTGLAVQDVAVANLIYHKALKMKIGRGIRFLK